VIQSSSFYLENSRLGLGLSCSMEPPTLILNLAGLGLLRLLASVLGWRARHIASPYDPEGHRRASEREERWYPASRVTAMPTRNVMRISPRGRH
jgi:hypothetical protein